MKLKTDRLILRDYQTTDFERVHIYGSNPDFSKYEFWGPNKIEDTHKFIADKLEESAQLPRFRFDLAVCLNDQDLLIGGCGLRRETETSSVGNLGWAINPEFQNKGYATEAAAAFIQYGFNELNLSLIYATCDSRNVASYKVMEKLGMKKVGFTKGDKVIKGHLRDSFRYEILK